MTIDSNEGETDSARPPSPSEIDRHRDYTRRADAAEAAQSWHWLWGSDAPLEYGSTSVVDLGEEWFLALKIRADPSQGPIVEEIRIFPKGRFSIDKNQRAEMDRAFWLQENGEEDFLDEYAYPGYPVPGAGVNTGLLRRIPYAEIVRQVSLGFIDNVEAFGLEPDLAEWQTFGHQIERRTSGGPDRGDAFYAAIAARFVALVASANKHPIKTIADEESYSENTVKSWLSQARKRQLLESLGRGRRGGALTDKAKQLLREKGAEDG